MKRCFKCGEDKSFSSFYKHKQMGDGYLGKCKECAKKDVAKHREENLEKIHAYERQRNMLPHRIAARAEYSNTEAYRQIASKSKKQYKIDNPIKYAAHTTLGNAIRDGKLFKQSCETCQDPKVHGHHDDYSKPLEVRWLCAIHHKEWHRENGPGING